MFIKSETIPRQGRDSTIFSLNASPSSQRLPDSGEDAGELTERRDSANSKIYDQFSLFEATLKKSGVVLTKSLDAL